MENRRSLYKRTLRVLLPREMLYMKQSRRAGLTDSFGLTSFIRFNLKLFIRIKYATIKLAKTNILQKEVNV